MDKRAVYLQASHVENMVNARFRRCRIGKVKMKREALPNPVGSPPPTIKDLRRWGHVMCPSDINAPPIVPAHGCMM